MEKQSEEKSFVDDGHHSCLYLRGRGEEGKERSALTLLVLSPPELRVDALCAAAVMVTNERESERQGARV